MQLISRCLGYNRCKLNLSIWGGERVAQTNIKIHSKEGLILSKSVRTFWIKSKLSQVLLEKRKPAKKTFPNLIILR